jgi:hypothetical protein
MRVVELTLRERAVHLYRWLLLIHRVLPVPSESDDVEWLGTGERAQNLALCGGMREVLDELIEHARILSSIPLPLGEWRPGDRLDDEPWRALSELERREVLSLLSNYENLISWGEGITCRALNPAGPGELMSTGGGETLPARAPSELREGMEYLKAERARVARFRHETGFLDKRRSAG